MKAREGKRGKYIIMPSMSIAVQILLSVMIVLIAGCSGDTNDDAIRVSIIKHDGLPQILINNYPRSQGDSWYGDAEAGRGDDQIIAQRVIVKHTSSGMSNEVLSVSILASSPNVDGNAKNMIVRIKAHLPLILNIRDACDVTVNGSQPTEYLPGEHVIRIEDD